MAKTANGAAKFSAREWFTRCGLNKTTPVTATDSDGVKVSFKLNGEVKSHDAAGVKALVMAKSTADSKGNELTTVSLPKTQDGNLTIGDSAKVIPEAIIELVDNTTTFAK
jgi:hypothetical protein